MPKETDEAVLSPYREEIERINAALEQPLVSRIPLAEDIARHSLLGAGKRLRPLLFVLSARLCGYDGSDLYRLATIFEYIHTASLLHDDVLDNAELRRRKASANRLWGNQAAVLEGDFLYSTSLSIAVGSGNLNMVRRLTRTTARMAEGQILELIHTNDWDTDRETYLEIIRSKTAELISAACVCGAIIAGAGGAAEETLGRFGLSAGMAFQLIDDQLDYASSQEILGKPAGKDLSEGKITLPLIYTLAGMTGSEKAGWVSRFCDRTPTAADRRALLERVRADGILGRVRAEAEEYVRTGAGTLEEFPPSRERDGLLTLNRYIVERTY